MPRDGKPPERFYLKELGKPSLLEICSEWGRFDESRNGRSNGSCASRSRSPGLAKKKLVETTLYSLSADAPACPDRRSGERYVSLLRVGALTVDGRRELCLIRNVSAGGMMIRPYSPITVGARITVELKHGESVSGAAQWCENGLVGVVFDEPIDVLGLLSAPGEQPRPRMPRIELNCTATLRHEKTVFRAPVMNISQGGICVDSPVDLPIGSDIVITLSGLHAAAGVVKWRDGDYYGIGFNRVYPVAELMRFLQDQQREETQRRKVA